MPTRRVPDHEQFMRLALEDAYRGIARGEGGPFGACITRKGKVVAVAHNRVLKTRNPTQHAEVCAIGLASKKIGTHVFAGCDIYSTTEPCPMCFSAIHWAQFDRVYFGTTVPDVKRLGFNELTISNATMKRIGKSPLELHPGLLRGECVALLEAWKNTPGAQTY
jgi:guanine deaminase